MKYTELKQKLEVTPTWELYRCKDLIMNDKFELYMKPRANPRIIKLEKNEVVILKGVNYDEVKIFLFQQAVSLVFATNHYECKRPEDPFNLAEKEIEDKYKVFLKYELGLRKYHDEIVNMITLIQEQMIGKLIELYNERDYRQALNKLGIKNVDDLIDYNPTYTY